eukprot:3191016-Rhodomonas_salina.1
MDDAQHSPLWWTLRGVRIPVLMWPSVIPGKINAAVERDVDGHVVDDILRCECPGHRLPRSSDFLSVQVFA